MMLCIGDVFDQAEAAALRSEVECLRFEDGRVTAGWAARLVKDNEQADANGDQLESLRSRLAERILQNEIFQLAVRPKALTPLMISRYRPGKLENARRDIFDSQGKTAIFDRLSKCSANLLRMWVDD